MRVLAALSFGVFSGGIVDDAQAESKGAESDLAGEVIAAYVGHVHASYVEVAAEAESFREAIRFFVSAPSEAGLERARERWIKARVPYGKTEVFRFYEGPIDRAKSANQAEGPEGRLNAWPLNEAYLDAVRGKPKAGLIQDSSLALSRDALIARNATDDEAEVTLGWHALEFMLWGQDFNAQGPGSRSYQDFVGKGEVATRRRMFLSLVTDLLVEDLRGLVKAWAPGTSNYAQAFKALPSARALGHIMTGMATLSGFELASERIAVPLDSRSQEDEHSCFSDTTHLDIWANALGVYEVYLGEEGRGGSASLHALASHLAPQEAARVRALIEESTALAEAVPRPIDQVLLAPEGDLGRAKLEALVTLLQRQAEALKSLGKAMKVSVLVHAE